MRKKESKKRATRGEKEDGGFQPENEKA